MNRNSVSSRARSSVFLAVLLAFALACVMSVRAHAQSNLVKISTDIFHDPDAQHKTEVEPDTYSWDSTMVATFQVARIAPGGGADLGFSTSTDGGKTWTHGYLPGWTVDYKGGTASAASDASVVYDAKHKVWLIEGLLLSNSGVNVGVSRSTDGLKWSDPITVDASGLDDKNWITCDNNLKSKFYGNCYGEWDQAFGGGLLQVSTSHDGGLTWGAAVATADQAAGSGAEPVVLPNGTLVVPFLGNNMDAFTSTDGGKTLSATFQIANINLFFANSALRSVNLPFPSVGIDGGGKVYVVWSDCSFRRGCSTNDLVYITSTNGTKWTSPVRIPIDPLNSTVDHFMPGLGVDRSTSGSTAHLTAIYYYFPQAGCSDPNCKIDVGFTTTTNGGKTWTAGKQLAGPMNINWLPQSQNGPMLADYLSSSYVSGKPFGVFIVAQAPGRLLSEAAYTTKSPLEALPGEPQFSSKGEKRIAHSTHPFPRFQGEEKAGPPSTREQK